MKSRYHWLFNCQVRIAQNAFPKCLTARRTTEVAASRQSRLRVVPSFVERQTSDRNVHAARDSNATRRARGAPNVRRPPRVACISLAPLSLAERRKYSGSTGKAALNLIEQQGVTVEFL